MSSDSSKYDNLELILHDSSSEPDAVPLRYLRKITNNFSDERILGKGGTGVVYKGVLQSGEEIAVKRLKPSMVCAQKLFENEVHHLMRLKHPNIVRFMGYCYETKRRHMEYEGEMVFGESSEMLLCLEYLPKGSLDRYLSDGSGLDWDQRYKIIEGICNGLHYLHEQIDNSILHLDLKPANVLLDDNLAPKITDFGLSRLLDQHQIISSPNHVGTFGYMAREYIHNGIITHKSDIFSLGVIIMELIMGDKNYPEVAGTSSEGFIELQLKKWRKTLEKAHGYIKPEIGCQQIKRCIQIGLACVNPDWTKRPTTTKIIHVLQGLESSDCIIINEAMPSTVQISTGVTKHIAYIGVTEEGKQSSNNKLCIENLEQAKRTDPQLGEASVSHAISGDPLRGKALYLENRERNSPQATSQCCSPQKRKKTSNYFRDAETGEASVSLSMGTTSTVVLIAVPGAPAGANLLMHPNALSTRSPFLRAVFERRAAAGSVDGEGVRLEHRELFGDAVEVGYEALRLVLDYLYSGRVSDLPHLSWVCVNKVFCAHLSCHPAVSFKVQVLFAAFRLQVAELTKLFQNDLLGVLDQVEVDNLPMILSVANICKKSCMKLLERCLEKVVWSNLDMTTLEKALPPDVVKQITDSRLIHGLVLPEDMEFSRNPRGYTVLHIAAKQRDTRIVASLLTKGDGPSGLTIDGRKAVEISKRLTKHGNYFGITEEIKPSPKDRLCIEILEQAERRDPQLGEASVSLAIAGDCQRGKMLYLENRAELVRIMFPIEARVAIDIAQVDGTLDLTLGSSANLPPYIRPTSLYPNETPFKMNDKHLARMRDLSKTVLLGKRFFPRCSNVLDKIMDDAELASLVRDTSMSTEKKRMFQDLQDVLQKAFNEDKEENMSAISSSLPRPLMELEV